MEGMNQLKKNLIIGTILLLGALSCFYLGRTTAPSIENNRSDGSEQNAREMGRNIREATRNSPDRTASRINPINENSTIHVNPRSGRATSAIGVVPSQIIESFGLTPEKNVMLQGQIDAFWKKSAMAVSERAIYDTISSDPSTGTDVYRIPALADGGRSLRDELFGNLIPIIGEKNAKQFIAGMNQQPFGAYGKYDAKLKFASDKDAIQAGLSDGDKRIRVWFEYTDPETGKLMASGNSTMDMFRRIWGDALIVHQP